MKHITVFLKESVALLKVKKKADYLDLTLGGGGHSLEILEELKEGTLYCFDLDASAIHHFEHKLKTLGFDLEKSSKDTELKLKFGLKKVKLINDNFTKIADYLGESKVDGIIADLGWSTDQLENLQGLSYEQDESELDMRFDQNLGVKASDLLNGLNRRELEKMFKDYADIYGKYNDQLVEIIISQRQQELFRKVGDLKTVLNKVFAKEKNKNSFYSKVFQALRIAVNQELINLKEMLINAYEQLNSGSSFLVIAFHSGEAKIIKSFFDEKVNNSDAEYLTKKMGEVFLTPSVDELRANINSRSAKLFGITKK